MVHLLDIPFLLDAERLMSQLRVRPGTENAAAFSELLDTVSAVARPKAAYEIAFIDKKADDSVVISGVRLTSRALRKNLDPVERVFPYVATCGTEADALGDAGNMLQALWLWTIKEALLDAAGKHLLDHLARHYRMTHWGTMHPGSGDAGVWPIEQQKELFSILGDVESAVGVRLMESMLMVPTMSVSGIVFPTEADFATCQLCHRENCPRRKAPFDQALWRATSGR